jgi:signal transduction histidine kinase
VASGWLAIVREIASAHGGRVWTEPGPECGSLFTLALPRAANAAIVQPTEIVSGARRRS